MKKLILIVLSIFIFLGLLLTNSEAKRKKKMNYTYGSSIVGLASGITYNGTQEEFVYIGTLATDHVLVVAYNVALKTVEGKAVYITKAIHYIHTTTTGPGYLDKGTFANDAWYNVWLIYNPTTGLTNAVISVLADVPSENGVVLPSGYTFFKRLGTVRSASAGNAFVLLESVGGKSFSYKELVVVQDGSFTATPAWTQIDLTAQIPYTATKGIFLFGSGGSIIGLSESANGFGGEYYRFGDATGTTDFGLGCTARANWATFTINLSLSYAQFPYYYVNNANATLISLGWEE